MTQHQPIPLRPDPLALRAESVGSFIRAATAHAAAVFAEDADPLRIAARRWPGDRVVRDMIQQTVTRAAGPPADTTNAATLATTIVRDLIAALAPTCASAALLDACLRLDFARAQKITLPNFAASAANSSFVGEGQPIPVRKLTISNNTAMSPYKLATIAVLTREMLEGSNAEALTGDCIMRSMAATLDSVLLGTAAATPEQPAGLRWNIAALAEGAGPSDADVFVADIGKLIDSIGPVLGGGSPIFVCSPGRKARMLLRMAGGDIDAMVLASAQLSADDVLCIAPAALASADGGVPQISASKEGVIHMDDAPAEIVDGGTHAAPTRSLFQTDCSALLVRLPISWSLRDSRGFAWLQAAGW
jgi:hypothetical protein